MKIWAVGGEQRPVLRRQDWNGYTTAVVVEISEAGVRRILEYRSAPAHSASDGTASHVFGAATISKETAYLCTGTEVLVCRVPDLAIQKVISHPCFNDVHHVAPAPDGSIYVVSSGLDAVVQLTPDGEVMRVVDVLGGNVWTHFSPDVDYRRIASTKPHRAHPNYVFFLDGAPWVTCHEQRVARSLDDPGAPAMSIPGEGPHDGCPVGRLVYFTTVDGRVVGLEGGVERFNLDLNRFAEGPEYPLGWCRGLLLQGRSAWVGFSRLRYTRLRRNVSWIRHGLRPSFHHKNPTRLALYDLETPSLVRQIELEEAGIHAIFSIHEAPGK